MRAAVLTQKNAHLEVQDLRVRKPEGREVLIRTLAAGVCHTDLSYAHGLRPLELPCVLGHEACGVVEAVGPDVTSCGKGDRVAVTLGTFCGHCERCVVGRPYLCESPAKEAQIGALPRLTGIHGPVGQFARLGTFGEQMLVHENACIVVPEDIPDEAAAIVGCGVLTGFGAVANAARVQAGESVVVIGCGGVGLAAVNAAVICGASRTIAVDLHPENLAIATALGATDIVCAKDGDPVATVMEMTKGGVDHVIEAVGHARTVEQGFAMLRRGGMVTVVGMMPEGMNVQIPGLALIFDKGVRGSTMGSNRFPADIPKIFGFYRQGRFELDKLITDRVPLSEINKALGNIGRPGQGRTVVTF